MKILRNSVLALVALVPMLYFAGCGPPKPEPTPEERMLALLKGQWGTSASGTDVTKDGISQKTDDYPNFTLTISGDPGDANFGFTTTGNPTTKQSPWPASGTWKFGSPVESIVRRQDPTEVVEITYLVTETDLELTFQYGGPGFPRTKSVQGLWVFKLKKV